MTSAKVFEQIYQDYLDQIAKIELSSVKDRLGFEMDGHEALIPFLGTTYRVSGKGVTDQNYEQPPHAVSVILFKYILLCPDEEPVGDDWVTYKDFRDAAPFVLGFLNSAEKPISRTYAGRMQDLEKAAAKLGGRHVDIGISSDLVMRFDALPRVPLLMMFNDEDEDFDAQCSLLFERRAQDYLDMECIAIIGMVLAEWLKANISPLSSS